VRATRKRTSWNFLFDSSIEEDEYDLYFEEKNSSAGEEQDLEAEIFRQQEMPPQTTSGGIAFFIT